MYNNLDGYWNSPRLNLDPNGDIKGFIYRLIGIIILVILCLILSSCSSVKYVPVETVRTEYRNHTDTIRQTDSVKIEKETIIREADSSLVARLGLQLKDNERAILILQKELERQSSSKQEHSTDTIIKTDSVQVPYPVERQLTKWEKIKMDAGGIALGLLIVLVIIVLLRWLMKTKFRL